MYTAVTGIEDTHSYLPAPKMTGCLVSFNAFLITSETYRLYEYLIQKCQASSSNICYPHYNKMLLAFAFLFSIFLKRT